MDVSQVSFDEIANHFLTAAQERVRSGESLRTIRAGGIDWNLEKLLVALKNNDPRVAGVLSSLCYGHVAQANRPLPSPVEMEQARQMARELGWISKEGESHD